VEDDREPDRGLGEDDPELEGFQDRSDGRLAERTEAMPS